MASRTSIARSSFTIHMRTSIYVCSSTVHQHAPLFLLSAISLFTLANTAFMSSPSSLSPLPLMINSARTAGAHGVMVGRAAYNNPWHILGHVDTAVYGASRSNLTRRQVLEKYQVYGDSVLLKYGLGPTVRDVVKPLLGFFHSAPGNGLWKRKADAAIQTCSTIKSFFDETLPVIPDSVLDSPLGEPPSGRGDLFANMDSLVPPPYRTREEDDAIAMYA
ncbi:hypothetical protein PIB30_065462 [Stylosanthes scabra]|uniref:DUS-like FMN-binding domain-containing protein n=1 Tax=Stylosanthes scabra TaxID=79078 RepID=A0ABU6XMW7_9FABA|nr:hypothetical protein [Stylosanthes scabra]